MAYQAARSKAVPSGISMTYPYWPTPMESALAELFGPIEIAAAFVAGAPRAALRTSSVEPDKAVAALGVPLEV